MKTYVFGETDMCRCFFFLASADAEWMSTISTHDVASVRIQNAGLKCAACRTRLTEIQDAKITKKIASCDSAHYRTTLSVYIFATKACIDNRKKLLIFKQQYLLHTCSRNMENCCPLTADTGWRVWGTPRVFTSLFFAIRSTAFNRGRHVHSTRSVTIVRVCNYTSCGKDVNQKI